MMHNPPHPGLSVKSCFKALKLTVTDAANKLGVTRKALSELINGRTGISAEMALRLAKVFKTSPESWLTQQMHYDLWKTKQKLKEMPSHSLRKASKTSHSATHL